MTKVVAGTDLAERIESQIPGTIVTSNSTDVWVRPDSLHDALQFLRDDESLDFQFLNAVTAVDYVEYFELLYHLTSLRRNSKCTVRSRLYSRDEPSVASTVDLWRGAELQEREIYDLMGITFDSHPNMKRVLLWEGFPGHPLRKDFIR
jgi:NADH-quinone oxidoreductase subunit C